MGIIRTELTLENPKENNFESLNVIALVGTGALHLCIPNSVALQLNLNEIDKRPVKIANRESHLCSYVGPIQLRWQNRTCFVGAMVIGDEVLLGAIPLEDMDLVIHPATLSLTVNPASPNYPVSMAK
jgi:clan AA aspartic protease